MNLFSLVATLGLDTSGFSKDVGKAVDEGKKLGQGLTKMFSIASKVTAATTLAAATAYISVVKKSADATADLEQNIGGSQTTWEGMARAMHQYATQAYKDVGLGTSQYLEMSTRMGNLLQGMGIDNRQAASMTIDAIERTADVAAALNVPIEDAMYAIEGMAKGNFTMMDNLGVAMSEDTLHAYALEQGIKRGTKGMSKAEKIALAIEMYMDKTAHHAGTFAKESEGMSGALAVLKASWQNFLDGSGDPSAFADSVAAYVDAYAEMVTKVAPRIWEGMKIVGKDIGGRIQNWVQEQGGWGNALLVPVNWLLGELGLPDVDTIVAQVSDWWTANTMYDKIKEATTWTLGKLDEAGIEIDWGDLLKKLGEKASIAVQARKFGKTLWNQILTPMWDDISPEISTWWTGMTENLNSTLKMKWAGFDFPTWEDIKTKAEEFWEAIKKKLSEMFTFTINLGNFTLFGGGNGGGQEPSNSTPTTSTAPGAGTFGNSVNITQNITTLPINTSDLASQLNYNLRYGGGNRVTPLSTNR